MRLHLNYRGIFGSVIRYEILTAVVLAVACAGVYVLLVDGIGQLLSETVESREIGAMWAVVSTIFVFRVSLSDRLDDTRNRLTATSLSLLICLVYLLIFPVTAAGIGIVVGLGSLLAAAVGRPQDAALTGITSTVVLVVADLGRPSPQWEQPLLRLVDTAVGIAVGLVAAGFLAWIVNTLSGEHRRDGGHRRSV